MQELDKGAITINEYRTVRGQDPVEWGDKPYVAQVNTGFGFDFSSEVGATPKKKEDENKRFKKKFEGFMNGRTTDI